MDRIRPTKPVAQHYLGVLDLALKDARQGRKLRPMSVVWPTGLDRRVALSLPLKVRTENCMLSAGFTSGSNQITARDLLRTPNAGTGTLIDLLFSLEAFLLDCVGNPRQERLSSESAKIVVETHGDFDNGHGKVEIGLNSWGKIEKLLRPVLSTAVEAGLANNLADVLNPQCIRIGSLLGVKADIEEFDLKEATEGELGIAGVMAKRLGRVLSKMSQRQQIIMQCRLLQEKALTLEEVGKNLGVTRERVRQIQKRITSKIDLALGKELKILAMIKKETIFHIVSKKEMEEFMKATLPEAQETAGKIIRNRLISEMGYRESGDYFLDECAKEIFESIHTLAESNVDDSGIVEEKELLELLPGTEWIAHWELLRKQCNLYEMYGYVSIRNSAKAKVKAAILSIGRPATKQEISQICGFSQKEVGAHISNIPSIVRADRERWGIGEWIEDEYDGIVGEIIQRIEEEGGATTTKRLLSELPSKFNVSPSSVQAYMKSPKFEINDGQIRLANSSLLKLRHLEDVIHGWGGNGEPFWTFLAEERHFEGYSVTGVPPEFMKELGCQPDGNLRLRVENVEMDDHRLSAQWPLATTTGCSIGYLSTPLRVLGIQSGDRVRVLRKGIGAVSIEKHDDTTGQQRENGANKILNRMKNRRRAL